MCPNLLGSWWLIVGKLSSPLLADVIVPSLYLPCQLGDRCGLLCCSPVQLADVVAVFGWIVLQGSIFAAFLAPELQDRKHSSKFTDHPVLKPKRSGDSEHLIHDAVCHKNMIKRTRRVPPSSQSIRSAQM